MRLLRLLLLVTIPLSAHAAVRITSPTFDSVTNTRLITVTGTAGSADGNTIKVTAAGTTYTATVTSGTWSVSDVRLALGFNRVRARSTTSGSTTWLAISYATLVDRGEQLVRIVWDTGTTDMLKDIARNTLHPDPSAAELDTFVTQVHARVAAVIQRAYDGVARVRFVNADGPRVQRIRIHAEEDVEGFGISPSDCGNTRPKEGSDSRVHLATYARSWRNITNWRPMERDDTLDTRIQDVAEAVGRTGAHEFGHSLGMVVCNWMNGCKKGHNCPSFDTNNPPIDRFRDGFFVMDPGRETLNRARIAEPIAADRTIPRTPAVFNARNRSYLMTVHPLP